MIWPFINERNKHALRRSTSPKSELEREERREKGAPAAPDLVCLPPSPRFSLLHRAPRHKWLLARQIEEISKSPYEPEDCRSKSPPNHHLPPSPGQHQGDGQAVEKDVSAGASEGSSGGRPIFSHRQHLSLWQPPPHHASPPGCSNQVQQVLRLEALARHHLLCIYLVHAWEY
jgi:hypothetical protein